MSLGLEGYLCFRFDGFLSFLDGFLSFLDGFGFGFCLGFGRLGFDFIPFLCDLGPSLFYEFPAVFSKR